MCVALVVAGLGAVCGRGFLLDIGGGGSGWRLTRSLLPLLFLSGFGERKKAAVWMAFLVLSLLMSFVSINQ